MSSPAIPVKRACDTIMRKDGTVTTLQTSLAVSLHPAVLQSLAASILYRLSREYRGSTAQMRVKTAMIRLATATVRNANRLHKGYALLISRWATYQHSQTGNT